MSCEETNTFAKKENAHHSQTQHKAAMKVDPKYHDYWTNQEQFRVGVSVGVSGQAGIENHKWKPGPDLRADNQIVGAHQPGEGKRQRGNAP